MIKNNLTYSDDKIDFSAQQLIDCDFTFGCYETNPQFAFKYVANNGIQLEDSYPYIGKRGECKYNSDLA